jgi:hypothetical protein
MRNFLQSFQVINGALALVGRRTDKPCAAIPTPIQSTSPTRPAIGPLPNLTA